MQADYHSSKCNKEQRKQKNPGRSVPQLKQHLLFIQFVLNIKTTPIKFTLSSQNQTELI